MGTNYYLIKPETSPCEHCGRFDIEDRWHIGKSSGGWCFGLHVLEDYASPTGNTVDSLEKWKELFFDKRYIILDEYKAQIDPLEMLKTITDRKDYGGLRWTDAWWYDSYTTAYKSEEDFHAKNYSERGPNGLLRHKIDGFRFVGHGDGTWDLIKGEFS